MKIAFYPPKSKVNPYINLLVNSLKKNGCEVVNENISNDFAFLKICLGKKKERPDLIHLNWIEENAASKSLLSKIKCRLFLLFFKLYKLRGGKIVWTMHNSKSHNLKGNQEKFISRFLSFVDIVMVHCSESINILQQKFNFPAKKTFFVPNGNYCSLMEDFNNHKQNEIHDKINLLYFGLISPYKGVFHLINAFSNEYINKNCNLIICGKPNTDELKIEIIKKCESIKQITLDLNYVSDEKLAQYLAGCDFVVLPFEKESMQNSSSAIMAFSCGKPVIIPKFGYINDISDKPFVITYDYDTYDNHDKELLSVLTKVVNSFSRKKEEVNNLGGQAKEFAIKELDWNSIGKKIVSNYKNVIYEE